MLVGGLPLALGLFSWVGGVDFVKELWNKVLSHAFTFCPQVFSYLTATVCQPSTIIRQKIFTPLFNLYSRHLLSSYLEVKACMLEIHYSFRT